MSQPELEDILGPELPDEMTGRERLRAVVEFRPVDRLPLWEPMGFLPRTAEEWVKSGFPHGCPPEVFFGLERVEAVPIDLGPLPELEPDALPVTTRQQFARVCRHYSCYCAGRYPKWWEDDKQAWSRREYPLGLTAKGPLAWLREWCGGEAARVLLDEPKLADAIMAFGVEFCIATLERAAEEVELDFAVIRDRWGLGLEMMIEQAVWARVAPLYAQLASLFRDHAVDPVVLYSDGDPTPLTPQLLDLGVNGIMPCAAAEGVDVLALAREQPRDLVLVGGMDARALSRDRRDADREARLKMPAALDRGGWLPCFNAPIGPEAKFDNYRTYWEAALEIAAGKWPPEHP